MWLTSHLENASNIHRAEGPSRTRAVVSVAPDRAQSARPTVAAVEDPVLRQKLDTSPRRALGSPQQSSARSKQLFNPESDPIPMRPRHVPDGPTSAPNHPQQQQQQHQRLFDPRRDDPMRFAVLNSQAKTDRQAPSSVQSSSVMDHSSISSYTSSTWTLTSSTGTSQSSAPPEQTPDKDGTSKFIAMLKKVYREITDLEKKIQVWDSAANDDVPTATVTMLKPGVALSELDESEKPDPLRALVAQHKQLSELYHSMITMILQPVPASMLSFVTKYQLPSRLWTNGIMHCIDSLRKMSNRLPGALEHMTGYMYWSYHFYESLYETSTLNEFMAPYKNNWIEALGDLARFQMRISSRQSSQEIAGPVVPLTEEALPLPEPRADDTPPPSIGIAAANAFDLEPESEIWRRSSQTWYTLVLKETPGMGKLHYYLGSLNVEAPDEELRGVYHFVKRCAFPAAVLGPLTSQAS